jgi:hypothetical protein
MGNVSGKICRQIQATHFMFNNFFEKRAVYYKMWKNIVETSRPHTHMTKWYMRIAFCISKATNTHSEYIILIAFPRQEGLHKRASMLICAYIACPVENVYGF